MIAAVKFSPWPTADETSRGEMGREKLWRRAAAIFVYLGRLELYHAVSVPGQR